MYCSLNDLKQRLDVDVLVRLTDDAGTDQVNEDVVNQAIEDASAEVDGYLQGRYNVPLQPVPTLVRRLAADIAIYLLFERRGLDDAGPDGVVYKSYQAARDTLLRISRGEVRIGAAEPPAHSEMQVKSADRVFSRDSLEGF